MGAEQSSSRADRPPAAVATVRKTCYYEVLGVDRAAGDDEYVKLSTLGLCRPPRLRESNMC